MKNEHGNGQQVAEGSGKAAVSGESVPVTESAAHASRLTPHACIGEIIEADSLQFRAECPRLYAAPPFGSFVRVAGAEHEVFGVVSYVATGTVDAGRQTQALHLPPERLAERMPQLALLLRTCFTALVVGYGEGDEILPYLPPLPPEIHRFIYPCGPTEVELLTREPDFLRILAAAEGPVEDLLAAAIRHGAAARGSGAPANAFVVECGKAVATLFRREPDRFQSVMRRLQATRRGTGAAWELPVDVV
jgi:hypothetical protein